MQIHHGYEIPSSVQVPPPPLKISLTPQASENISIVKDFAHQCTNQCRHAAPTESIPLTQPPDFGAIHDTDQLLLNMTLSDLQEIMSTEHHLDSQRLRELQRMA